MTKASDFLAHYGSDKVTLHAYGEIYDQLLSPFQRTASAVLELGIQNGYSMRAWRDYFSKAQIYGIDDAFPESLSDCDSRITPICCSTLDQIKFTETIKALPELAIAIDDCSHDLKEQLWAIVVVWPKVKSGGLIIVEDIQPQNIPHLDLFRCFPNVKVLDFRQDTNRYDDVMVVITKP